MTKSKNKQSDRFTMNWEITKPRIGTATITGGNNINLRKATAAKKDEFYTQLVDIENELRNYFEHFRGKVVYCNCDDPRISNFFRYFSYNFKFLGLKKLIATCYRNTDPELFSKGVSEKALKLEYYGFRDGETVPNNKDIEMRYLDGDGDFRSDECIELLKEADIVVTNPPFSLFREYVAQLMEYDKQFLIIGNQNAITYKDIFPLMRDNKLWLGVNQRIKDFQRPDGTMQTFGNICWFTNMSHKSRNDSIILHRKYTPEDYPTYDNYDAINVDYVVDIPENYDGYIGVPITFMYKFNPEQFEIVGLIAGNKYSKSKTGIDLLCGDDANPLVSGKRKYARIVIKRKQ